MQIDESELISSDVEFFEDIFIEDDLELQGSLNNRLVDEVVTTNTKQELTAIYEFKSKVSVAGDAHITELVNGINITNWYNTRLKSYSIEPQVIKQNWFVQGDLMFENETVGNYCPINSVDIGNYALQVESERLQKHVLEKGFIVSKILLNIRIFYRTIGLNSELFKHLMQHVTQVYTLC